MDKNIDFSNLNGYQSYDFPDPENFFNPMNQYEQGYLYYKCLLYHLLPLNNCILYFYHCLLLLQVYFQSQF